jgi:hypothetical protein
MNQDQEQENPDVEEALAPLITEQLSTLRAMNVGQCHCAVPRARPFGGSSLNVEHQNPPKLLLTIGGRYFTARTSQNGALQARKMRTDGCINVQHGHRQ